MFKKLLVCLLPLVTLVGCNKNGGAPLYITNLGSDAIIQYHFHTEDEQYTPKLDYSLDRNEWKSLHIEHEVTTDIVTLSKDQTVYFRGDNPNYFCRHSWDLNNDGEAYFNFVLANPSADTKIKIGGNIMSLLSVDNYANKKDIPCDGCFNRLFVNFGYTNGNIEAGDIDASELLLPAIEVRPYTYWAMFRFSAISKAPLNLPATSAAKGIYEDMFWFCENLITAPIINLSNLLESSCSQMFDGCENLDISKEDGKVKIFTCPDTSADYCVKDMFNGTKHEIVDPQPSEVFYYN